MIHFFDTTLDWSTELLETRVPDLVVVQSADLLDAGTPWKTSPQESSCSVPWIQYVSADVDEQFISMTFFDAQSATEHDRRQVNTNLKTLDDGKRSIDRYSCMTPNVKCASIVRNSNVIQCRRRTTAYRPQATTSSNRSLAFQRTGFPNYMQASRRQWQYLSIEPVDDPSNVDFSVFVKLDEDPALSAKGSQDRGLSQDLMNQQQKFRLYAVASSQESDRKIQTLDHR